MQCKDMLQLMINATDNYKEDNDARANGEEMYAETQCPVHKKLGTLTDKEVVGHAAVLLTAGYETTANALVFTSYLLALNPDIQEKLQSEIDSYFDEKPVSFSFS